jgi:hypothetical protein
VVRNAASRAVLRSQQPTAFADPAHPPLEILSSPRGAVRRAQQYPSRPYAGSFTSLVARGRKESVEAAVETTHRFRAKSIETRWKITRRKRARYSVDVLFPSWGKRAGIEAVLRDGQRVPLAGPIQRRQRVRMRNVAYFYIAGEEGGYVVVPAGRRRGSAHIFKPKPQAASPKPGPTLAVALADRAKFKRLDFAAQIAPASSAQHADAVARRLISHSGPPAPKRVKRRRKRRRKR